MALATRPDSEPLIPLKRVLPVVGSNVELAAHHVVRGRLRFHLRFGRTIATDDVPGGWRIYVPREDYLSLCEAAWDKRVRRLGGTRPEATLRSVEPPARGTPADRDTTKPIHDGQPLDRYRRSPVLQWARALNRWWRGR